MSLGTDIEVEIGFTNVNLGITSPTSVSLKIWDSTIDIDINSPILDIGVDTPQIILPITGIVPGPTPALKVIWGEIPNGTVDGINKIYSSTHPYSSNQLAVFLNGLRQRRTNDYNETGSQFFSFISAPLPGDSLSIDYIQP